LTKKLPGDAGKAVGDVLSNPDLKKDPGKAIEQGLGGLLGGKNKESQPPATQPK
jgi:hypothetical protein